MLLMPVHSAWLTRCTQSYGFSSPSETLRHLIFFSNGESTANKRLIFRIKRCLHCHVGAPHNLHAKVTLPEEVYIYKFQLAWLETVTAKCNIKSLDKTIRIICDYYMSRTEQARNEHGEAAAVQTERDLFTAHREHDSRVKVAEERERGLAEQNAVIQILDSDTQSDPAACSPEATAAAILNCQVGRASATLAEALMETAEETSSRRAKEREIEDTEDMKAARKIICKALGSVMG
jgi:hypothetical protein